VAIFVAIVGLVAIFAIVVLATMGNQIGNVFSNVAAALTASP
jgi:Flp pilus assembly pilin Flp